MLNGAEQDMDEISRVKYNLLFKIKLNYKLQGVSLKRITKEIYFCSRFYNRLLMAQKAKTVDHLGTVQEITTNDIMVKILSQSACAACHANGICGVSDSTDKVVVVHKPNHNYCVGQDVKVVLKQTLGFRALLLGYLTPFLIVVTILIVLSSVGFTEGKAGLVSLLVLVPYYFGLYLFRNLISKQFNFDIESI